MIELHNVTKTFGDIVAIDDLSLTIEKGELVTLLGESGCGKTTTIRCIAGLETIDSGEIYIDGDIHSSGEDGIIVPPRKKDVGMVFQNYAIWPHKNVYENVSYGLEVRNVDKQKQRDKVAETLERVGLGGLEDRKPNELSGGQQQRVVLARSLVYEPKALLLDEPLANLDAALRESLQKEIKRLQRELGITFLYVTHNQEEAMVLSDRIAIIDGGELVEYDSPETIYNDPKSLYSADFIGKSNLFNVEKIEKLDDCVLAYTDFGELRIDHARQTNPEADTILIRPHHFSLANNNDPNTFEAKVKEVFFNGAFIEIVAQIGGRRIDVQIIENDLSSINPGDSINLSIPPRHPTLL